MVNSALELLKLFKGENLPASYLSMTLLVLALYIQIEKLNRSKTNIILYFATKYFISAKPRQHGLCISLRIKGQMYIQVLISD